jgi:broad specificity phosphatase PhoE
MDVPLRRIYLIRHAESAWNSEHRVQGTCLEVPLSPTGLRQAHLLGLRFEKLPHLSVFSSDAARALETARRAFDGNRITVTEEIRELCLGEWEGKLISEIRDRTPGKLEAWYRSPSTVKLEGGEDLGAFRRRVVSFMDRLIGARDAEDAVVVTHGGVICAYLTHLLSMPLDELWSFSLPNASVTTVVLDFKPRLRCFGDTSHLDATALGLDGMPAPL